MTTSTMSIIAAGYVIYSNIQEMQGVFGLYCQQTKEYFQFMTDSESTIRMRMFCYKTKSYVIRNYTSFIDLGEQKQYQVVNANNGTFDILDVNEKEYANVRKEGNLYKVLDYKQGKTFDFELIKMEN